jgi:hypothetical protein
MLRKVFLSTIKMKFDKPEFVAVFKSRDMELGEQQHFAPISYLLEQNVEPGDNVTIITGVTHTPEPQENYRLLKEDLEGILAAHQAKGEFIVIDEPDFEEDREQMDSLTFNEFFKDVSDQLQSGDRIYADMTFGMKCYTLGMYIAMEYAAKACEDLSIEQVVYSQRYRGEGSAPATSDIIDISSLFYISSIVNKVQPGQKRDMDGFLNFIIG